MMRGGAKSGIPLAIRLAGSYNISVALVSERFPLRGSCEVDDALDDPLSRQIFRLSLLCCLWAYIALALALFTPQQEFLQLPSVNPVLVITVTLALLLALVVATIRLIGRTGRTLSALPLVMVFFLLVVVLFLQVGCHLGMNHFSSSHRPTAQDWVFFPLFHVLRATDLFDFRFNIPAPLLQPNSSLTLWLLALLRLLFGVLALRLLIEWSGRTWETWRKFFQIFPASPWSFFSIPIIFVTFGISALLLGAVFVATTDAHFPFEQLPWWLLAQCVSVVDLGDWLTLFDLHLHLHAMPENSWVRPIGLCVRAALMILLARGCYLLGRHLALNRLGGFGLHHDDLEEIYQHDPDPARQVIAGRRVFVLTVLGPPRLLATRLISFLSCTLIILLGWHAIDGRGYPIGETQIFRLASVAIVGSDEQSESALQALDLAGPNAERSAQVLGVGMASVEPPRRRRIMQTLAKMGTAGVDPLVDALLRGPTSEMRQEVHDVLVSLGPKAIDSLSAWLDQRTAIHLVPIFEKLQPRWYETKLKNPKAEEIRQVRRILASLADADNGSEPLLDLGEVNLQVVSQLLNRLGEDCTTIEATRLLRNLERLGPVARTAVPQLIELWGQKRSPEVIARALDRLDPAWRARLPQ
jgi:hypothetical protein